MQILVVDHEPMVCDVVTDALADLGATIHRAHGGLDGAAMLRSRIFALALIDGMLSGISAFAVAELAAQRNTPSLLMTGHPDAIELLERFGFPHLTKPFGILVLIEEARRIMADSQTNLRLVSAAVARMRLAKTGVWPSATD